MTKRNVLETEYAVVLVSQKCVTNPSAYRTLPCGSAPYHVRAVPPMGNAERDARRSAPSPSGAPGSGRPRGPACMWSARRSPFGSPARRPRCSRRSRSSRPPPAPSGGPARRSRRCLTLTHCPLDPAFSCRLLPLPVTEMTNFRIVLASSPRKNGIGQRQDTYLRRAMLPTPPLL